MTAGTTPTQAAGGVDLSGTIPSHWSLIAVKRVAMLKSGDMISADSVVSDGTYPVYGGNGFRGYTERFTHEGNYLLIGRQGALCGNINYARGKFWASEHAIVVTLTKTVSQAWLGYVLIAMDLNRYSLSSAQPGLSVETIKNLLIPLPPPAEQHAIADFLDRETAKIDALIAAQERLIALLDEKRRATITHAVTKGLDPNVPMKESRVEWMGDVPAGWQILPLGRITRARCDGPFGSGLKSEHYSESGVRVIRLQNIRLGYFDGTDAAFIDEYYYRNEIAGHDVCEGDILIAGLGDDRNTVGRACTAPDGIGPAMVKADCFRFRLDTSRSLPAFVAMQLTAGAAFDAGVMSSGSTRSRIPLSVMATRDVTLPPIAEQRAIADFLDELCGQISAAQRTAKALSEELRERRTALITAAVTGQIDVSRPVITEVAE